VEGGGKRFRLRKKKGYFYYVQLTWWGRTAESIICCNIGIGERRRGPSNSSFSGQGGGDFSYIRGKSKFAGRKRGIPCWLDDQLAKGEEGGHSRKMEKRSSLREEKGGGSAHQLNEGRPLY